MIGGDVVDFGGRSGERELVAASQPVLRFGSPTSEPWHATNTAPSVAHTPPRPDASRQPAAGRLPNFIIGGAPRSGTTWLYRVLEKHPSIYLARPLRPEPKFFLVDEEYAQGLDYYKRTWFGSVPDHFCAGEKSTNYLESPSAAGRVGRDIPDIRLIFLLREPASRAVSHYHFSRLNGLEHLPIADALAAEDARSLTYEGTYRYSRPFSYFARGLYADHLENWLRVFARHQILILRYEDVFADPTRLVSTVHRFLDVEPRPSDARDVGVVNSAGSDPVSVSVIDSLKERYAQPNHRLYRLLGTRLWDAP